MKNTPPPCAEQGGGERKLFRRSKTKFPKEKTAYEEKSYIAFAVLYHDFFNDYGCSTRICRSGSVDNADRGCRQNNGCTR